MNSFRILPGLVLVALATPALLGATTRRAPPTAQPTVQLQVEAPFVFDPGHRDAVADAFSALLERTLVSPDRSLAVEPAHGDDLRADQPRLTVTLLSWRPLRLGDIECRLTAYYQIGDARQSLGTFEGRQSAIVRSRISAAHDYERAAEDAARQLRDALRTRGLL